MEAKVLEYIRRNQLILPGDRILVAVSGGPDSVCLLHLLVALRSELQCSLGIIHINHGLRGEESDREERFVEALAHKLGLPFYSKLVSISQLSQQRGIGTEETARHVRYEYFDEIMSRESYDKTALAHNLNDQAETILHRLIRGTGLNGLAGMRSIRDGRFIRPLLEIRRSEIEDWLGKKYFDFKIDSSNLVADFTRNRIRLELLPELEQFNPDILGSLSNMSEALAQDRAYLEAETQKKCAKFLIGQGTKITLERAAFHYPSALTSRLIFEAIRRSTGSAADIRATHIQAILQLQAGETGHSLNLPDQLVVYNHYGDLEFTQREKTSDSSLLDNEVEDQVVELKNLPKTLEFGLFQISFGWVAEDAVSGQLDAQKVGEKLIIRRRRPHDRMKMLGMTGHKKVKNIFIDKKIHRHLRDYIPVITDETGEIAFIYPGICGEAFRITENTDKIIYITITEIENEQKHIESNI